MFPHHENEVAQSEADNGCQFAHYWLHNGYINVDNRKMSKSLNNFFTVRDVAKEFDYEVIRFFMLSAHYRNPINFSHDLLLQAQAGLNRIYTCIDNLEFLKNSGGDKNDNSAFDKLDSFKDEFIAAMDDDINTADAISAICDLVKFANTEINEKTTVETIDKAISLIRELGGVLGILQNKKDEIIDEEIEKLIEDRNNARKNKDFALADKIRYDLKAKGIILEDTRQGVKWRRDV